MPVVMSDTSDAEALIFKNEDVKKIFPVPEVRENCIPASSSSPIILVMKSLFDKVLDLSLNYSDYMLFWLFHLFISGTS